MSHQLQLRSLFRAALTNFAASSAAFAIVRSVPADAPAAKAKTIYVLDSSFNPPSKAHTLIAQNALALDEGDRPARLLLLLATQNADKKHKPAANEDRLVMMTLLADELSKTTSTTVDIGVTKKPYFHDKAQSIDDSHVYGYTEQVHLTGYDTIIRIFDSKYYPADQKLRVLDPFLSKHRLRVTYRLNDMYGSKQDQDAYIEGISDGSRSGEGMRAEWKDKIDMVDDASDSRDVSSTEARNACMYGRLEDLEKYVGKQVSTYIRDRGLYQEKAV